MQFKLLFTSDTHSVTLCFNLSEKKDMHPTRSFELKLHSYCQEATVLLGRAELDKWLTQMGHTLPLTLIFFPFISKLY